MSALRWLTAGESHGPALVGNPRGAPRRRGGDQRRRRGRAGPPSARLRPRGPDGLRAGRRGVPRRHAARAHPGRAGRASASATPSGRSGSEVMAADPVDADGLAAPTSRRRQGAATAADPAAAGPRRPRRHAEVRLRRRPAGAGAGLARETAARVALGEVAARVPEQASASGWSSPTVAIGAGRGSPDDAPLPGARRRRAPRRRPGALRRPRDVGGHGRRGRRRPARRATPSAGSSRCSPTACRRASAPTCTGTGGSTPGWPAR